MSYNTVKDRIRKLEKRGYILRFAPILNPQKFGKKINAIIKLKLSPGIDIEEVAEELRKFPQLTQIILVDARSEFDILALGWFTNCNELNAVKEELHRRISIKSNNIILGLEQIKNTFLEV